MQYAQIVLPLNLKGSFTYKVPQELISEIQPGMRVLVPFGGKKIYTGIVLELHNNAPDDFVAKEVISMLDEKPILPEEQIRFWNWLSDYYLCNLGEIYRLAFPSSLKLESETYLKLKPGITVDFENLDVNEMYLIQALEVRQLVNLTDIEAFIPKKEIIKTINSLIDLQYIEIDEKIAEKYKAKEVAYVRINGEVLSNQNLTEILLKLNKAPKQKDLFLLILEKQTEKPDLHIKKAELFEDGYFGSSHFKALADKGLVEEYYMQKDRIESYEGEIEEIEELSEEQKIAKSEIDEAFEEGKNVLLHGVTSSGKTHIYLEKIEECIRNGKNVLFLLPEISLTKQITQRLEKKYGRQLGFYHQKLTDFERVEVWRRIKQNDISILVGTRNALFLPYKNLGLIVVDEEHDSAYKPREVTPYFNAKDAALVLGGLYKAGVILGSATPSVDSYYRARKDKMKYIFLNERFGNVNLPEYELINFKEAQESKNVSGNFSLKLIDEIKKTIDEKKQAIVLHNRRGYANVIECETCGYVNYCSNCDVVMTYHKAANEMKCHYCGQRASKPRTCPKCNSENLNERGVGVEQIHEEVSKLFPENEVDRMDVDSMRKKFAYEKLYEKIEDGETDIVVGTQMISKGLDFDHIELVAIPKADSLLYVQDFRAEERAYQLITQVSGRAGRVSGKGKILIQTYNPDHSVFQLIKMNNPAKIYKYILTERQKFHYPPFTKLIMIELKHRRDDKVDRASQFLGSILRKYLPEECILGPERAQIARLNNLYQFQILLKLPRGKNYEKFKSLVLISLKEFDEITAYQSIKKDVFVDF
ncbi:MULTISPECIES: replication restart helicase PriA [Chryseobacterium]|uniref:Replication restart protein PriA n=1 Tax=Chryseobacterium pennae TaxID=2258962 RepID=A0A3D9C9A2_9FLAO|nr:MULTISPECIES: primosomal protein N' [Chryseobacterium]MCS4302151.1 primosomal protein N' (replication factor Y) [Chryseobacterium sp. BIGb0232]REC62062.1 primosomal protein N' [Chryseobacterium pennae]ROS18097.1 replication restart DNA helicase PriA [Chryseobacterium nakagawai]